MLNLARQLLERQAGKLEPADFEDRYEACLREIINAKRKGEAFRPEKSATPRGDNVIDLKAALKRSLGRAGNRPAASGKALRRGKRAGTTGAMPTRAASRKRA